MTTFKAHCTWFATLAAGALLSLSGCASRTEPDPTASEEATADRSTGPEAARPIAAPSGSGERSEQSIHLIRQPNSRVAIGSRVVLGGPAIKVTAWSRGRIWIQESEDSGLCEIGDEGVAYRAITVVPSSTTPVLATGQRVEVEGVVIADASGRRSIGDAVVKSIGEPGVPYEPHCERDGVALASDALDDVLVLTAGSTLDHEPPQSDGSWSLTPCFNGTGGNMTVGASMTTTDDWRSGWYWLRGVRTRTDAGPRIEPRDADDFFGFRLNDACL